MQLSSFGEKFTANSGISSLMEDLGAALDDDPTMLFMGGGNPGRIEVLQEEFARSLRAVLDNSHARHQMLGSYQSPQGDLSFRVALAKHLKHSAGWDLGPEHIAIANGSQSAFFVLYNLFAGKMPDGTQRHIHLPLSPEYVGYRDLGLSESFFTATQPRIERNEHGEFKYRIDFDALSVGEGTAALCLSRPSNPTGNVIGDDELSELDRVARGAGMPLILDGAYGYPFPVCCTQPLRHIGMTTRCSC